MKEFYKFVILAVLATLSLKVLSDSYLSEEKEGAFFGLIKTAIKLYYRDCNRYPSSFSEMVDRGRRNCDRWNGPYWGESIVLDTWGRPYLYLLDNSNLPLIVTSGRDKKFGTKDDVVLKLFEKKESNKNIEHKKK